MIGAMISRHPLSARFRFLLCTLAIAAWMPSPASAGELMPFEIPEEEVQWDQIELEEFNTSLSTSREEEAEPAPPVDPGPDWPAPAIDAYVDTSFSEADFGSLNFNETPGGYRFIAGFRLDTPRLVRWTAAAEFGYTRLGRAERKITSVDDSAPDYRITRTDTYNIDLSSLDFGTRIGYRLLPSLDVYGRGGLQFYHVANKAQTQLDFTPKNNNPPKDTDLQQPASSSDSKASLFGTLGIAIRLGSVPSLYVEYGTRNISGDIINIGNVGVLMNF